MIWNVLARTVLKTQQLLVFKLGFSQQEKLRPESQELEVQLRAPSVQKLHPDGLIRGLLKQPHYRGTKKHLGEFGGVFLMHKKLLIRKHLYFVSYLKCQDI